MLPGGLDLSSEPFETVETCPCRVTLVAEVVEEEKVRLLGTGTGQPEGSISSGAGSSLGAAALPTAPPILLNIGWLRGHIEFLESEVGF